MLKIDFPTPNRTFQPGTKLNLTIRWNLPLPPEKISLRLFWYTIGKGSSDSKSVISHELEAHQANDSQSWSVELPRGPLSCRGKYLTIQWVVEAECESDGEETQEEFDLAWGVGPLALVDPENSVDS